MKSAPSLPLPLPSPLYTFRLYIVGDAPNSARALANLNQLRERYFPTKHQLEVVDVTLDPLRAQEDGIFMTPVLIKLTPEPTCRIVGALSDFDVVLAALGLDRT